MSVMDAIRARYSCRRYVDKVIEPEKLNRILESARLAPSARNDQDWRFILVTEPGERKKLAEAASGQIFMADAGVIIAACTLTERRMKCGQPSGPINAAIALEHMALTATEQGLATCWIGSFDQQAVKRLLGIPETVTVVELMSLGYPADVPGDVNRKLLEEIVCHEKWQFKE